VSVATLVDVSERAFADAQARRASSAILISDVGALLCALPLGGAFANLIRSAFDVELLDIFSRKFTDHALASLMLGAAMIIWLSARKHYMTRQTFSAQSKDILIGCAGALFAAALLDFATKSDMPRLTVFVTWGAAALFMIVGRHLTKRALMARGAWFTPVLLLGTPAREQHFSRISEAHPELGFRIVSALDIRALLQFLGDHPDERSLSVLAGALARWNARAFLIAPSKEDYKFALELVEVLQRVRAPFVFAPETGSLGAENMMLHSLAPFDGVLMTPLDSLDRPIARAAKHIAEQAAAAVALILLSPVFVALSALVASDGGPVFFRQQRIGVNGKRFECLKFRSMAADAEARLADLLRSDPEAAAEWARAQKLTNDPRITRIGHFLRKTSLDELPQLINVVLGEMSIVGPRPVVPGEIDKYGRAAEYYYRVKPGVTGLWQVNGRNNVSYDERVRLDSYYVRNWTLWRDLCIALKTVPEMLWKRSGM